MAASGGHWIKIAQGNIGALEFVPKGQSAAQAITGVKPTGGGWPASIDDVHVVKGLGGSTGAQLVQDDNGNLYVMKKGANADHLMSESATDKAYEILGATVPEHKIYNTPGGPVKLSKFVDGKEYNNLDAADSLKVETALRKNFVADALLGNWDVVGLSKDNIMLGKDGKTYRIDNGGALLFKATGKLKTSENGLKSTPNELFTMRSSKEAGPVFKSLSLGEIVTQAKAVIPKQQAVLDVMPANVKVIMNNRFNNLKKFIETVTDYKGMGLKDNEIEFEIKSDWGIGG